MSCKCFYCTIRPYRLPINQSINQYPRELSCCGHNHIMISLRPWDTANCWCCCASQGEQHWLLTLTSMLTAIACNVQWKSPTVMHRKLQIQGSWNDCCRQTVTKLTAGTIISDGTLQIPIHQQWKAGDFSGHKCHMMVTLTAINFQRSDSNYVKRGDHSTLMEV